MMIGPGVENHRCRSTDAGFPEVLPEAVSDPEVRKFVRRFGISMNMVKQLVLCAGALPARMRSLRWWSHGSVPSTAGENCTGVSPLD